VRGHDISRAAGPFSGRGPTWAYGLSGGGSATA